MYPETTQGAYFALDETGMYADKTCFILISNYSIYLQRILSTKLYEYAYKKMFSSVELGEKGFQYNKHAIIKLPVLRPNQPNQYLNVSDKDLYRLYGLSDKEISFIEAL
jgi:hypothetical protein